MTNKTCITCGVPKISSEFHKRTASKDGLQSNCKSCNRDQRKAYYKTAAGKSNNISSGRRWSEQMRKKVYEYLLNHPCSCGENDPVALDFDHNDPSIKIANISTMVKNGYGWERILAEINKCTVRCANCHRKRTAQQFNWYWFI